MQRWECHAVTGTQTSVRQCGAVGVGAQGRPSMAGAGTRPSTAQAQPWPLAANVWAILYAIDDFSSVSRMGFVLRDRASRFSHVWECHDDVTLQPHYPRGHKTYDSTSNSYEYEYCRFPLLYPSFQGLIERKRTNTRRRRRHTARHSHRKSQ